MVATVRGGEGQAEDRKSGSDVVSGITAGRLARVGKRRHREALRVLQTVIWPNICQSVPGRCMACIQSKSLRHRFRVTILYPPAWQPPPPPPVHRILRACNRLRHLGIAVGHDCADVGVHAARRAGVRVASALYHARAF